MKKNEEAGHYMISRPPHPEWVKGGSKCALWFTDYL